MYGGITSGRVLDGVLLYPFDWREVSMKQSVGKCKQTNLESLCSKTLYIYTPLLSADHLRLIIFSIINI